jgi:hypothetical protein
VTLKSNTYFEQVPLTVVKKIAKIRNPKDLPVRKELEVTQKKRAIEAIDRPSPDGVQIMSSSYESSFDIFQMESSGSVLWQGSAASIEEAKQRVKELQADTAAQYMIVGLRTGSKLLINPDVSDRPSAQQPDTAPPQSCQQA